MTTEACYTRSDFSSVHCLPFTVHISQPALRPSRLYFFILTLILAALACSRPDLPLDYSRITPLPGMNGLTQAANTANAPAPLAPPTATLVPASPPVPDLPIATPRPTVDITLSPTPDIPRTSPLDRQTTEHYTVQRNDTLSEIGQRYGVSAEQIAAANGIQVTDTLFTGQALLIPLPADQPVGPDLKIIPDSEFVYGPGNIGFNLDGFIQAQHGYLADYTEDIPNSYLDGSAGTTTMSGSEIIQFVAQHYSVNSRVLLAVLEYQSGWVTDPRPGDKTLTYPMRRVEAGREGLYRQLTWTANQLNGGYYAWRASWLVSFVFPDGSLKIIAPGLNAGTVAIQNFFSKVLNAADWTQAMSPDGFLSTYWAMFGNRFAYAWEPLVPPDLVQPTLQLPFESEKIWAFTGGPHGAWDTGSAWAALDFAPPAEAEGCTLSDEWVVASAPGLIVRAENGSVLEDLDGDGYEETGWVLFYMHVESRDRVAVGARVNAGDRLGHPSCEGGVANGTHVHFARKYNGEWIPADGPIPFILDGWISAGLGQEYDGKLTLGLISIEACDCRAPENEISRP